MGYEVDYCLVKLSPALTFVLTFIPVLLFLDFDVERRRRDLEFEAGDHRRSPLKAVMRRGIAHSKKKFRVQAPHLSRVGNRGLGMAFW